MEANAPRGVAGFDPRLLLKLEAPGVRPEDFESIPGLEVVSEEEDHLVVLFASEEGREEFRRRLETMAAGGEPKRKELFWATRRAGDWRPEERMGPALAREGVPAEDRFVVDVDFWALERPEERRRLREHFRDWSGETGMEVLDWLDRDAVLMARVRTGREGLERLLAMRDVRIVDLPPRFAPTFEPLQVELGHLDPVTASPPDAPGVVVLDSGIEAGHPLLAPAVGEAVSALPGKGPEDEHGHGTAVVGIALYGDVARSIEAGSFTPRLRIFSGRILDEQAESDRFVENAVSELVQYFHEHYGCRVFNLSFGDERKVYAGGHVRGLAATLDELAHRLQVLFVVSTGNFRDPEQRIQDWRGEYPGYLLEEDTRLLDPAPALNALTVGSLARRDKPLAALRYPSDVNHQPVARRDQPSPFTRRGPGPLGAVKPELVAYGGNLSVDLRQSAAAYNRARDGLGEITLARFESGRLFGEERGTSMAAPQVAHLAGLLLARYPRLSAAALRAVLLAHARVPRATQDLLPGQDAALRRLVGYGMPDEEAALFSLEERVTLLAQDEIGGETHHFYELPLPEDFLSERGRERRITVALAHAPPVRTSRLSYRASKLSFKVVRGDPQTVTATFRHAAKEERLDNIPETGDFRPKPRERSRGTAQVATWEFNAPCRGAGPLFVVVTRQWEHWAKGRYPDDSDSYALVVVVEDRQRSFVPLYDRIREQLRSRARIRVEGA